MGQEGEEFEREEENASIHQVTHPGPPPTRASLATLKKRFRKIFANSGLRRPLA